MVENHENFESIYTVPVTHLLLLRPSLTPSPVLVTCGIRKGSAPPPGPFFTRTDGRTTHEGSIWESRNTFYSPNPFTQRSTISCAPPTPPTFTDHFDSTRTQAQHGYTVRVMISNQADIAWRAAQIEGFDVKRETRTPAATCCSKCTLSNLTNEQH